MIYELISKDGRPYKEIISMCGMCDGRGTLSRQVSYMVNPGTRFSYWSHRTEYTICSCGGRARSTPTFPSSNYDATPFNAETYRFMGFAYLAVGILGAAIAIYNK